MSMNQSKTNQDGFYYRSWQVADDTTLKGVVLLVHGLGEHCERYTAIAAALNAAGYALYSMDLPGHGQSQGRRGHINRFTDYQQAVLSLHDRVKSDHPDQAIFLLGHSMGGLITTHLLLDHQSLFKGALLSGAAIESPQAPPAIQVFIIRILAAILPKLGVLTLDASGISRDPQVVETYMNDPLVNKGKLSNRLLAEMFKTMKQCKKQAAKISLPIRIMHGGEDVMTAPAGSQLLHDSVSSSDKELKIYDGLYHEIFNEPEAPEIYKTVIEWLNRHWLLRSPAFSG